MSFIIFFVSRFLFPHLFYKSTFQFQFLSLPLSFFPLEALPIPFSIHLLFHFSSTSKKKKKINNLTINIFFFFLILFIFVSNTHFLRHFQNVISNSLPSHQLPLSIIFTILTPHIAPGTQTYFPFSPSPSSYLSHFIVTPLSLL